MLLVGEWCERLWPMRGVAVWATRIRTVQRARARTLVVRALRAVTAHSFIHSTLCVCPVTCDAVPVQAAALSIRLTLLATILPFWPVARCQRF